jgi:hypothetical protein
MSSGCSRVLRNAGSSGFVVIGYPPQQPVKRAALELRFDDGESTELDITHAIEAVLSPIANCARSFGSLARPGGAWRAATFRGMRAGVGAELWPHLRSTISKL